MRCETTSNSLNTCKWSPWRTGKRRGQKQISNNYEGIWNLMKSINSHIQEVQQNPTRGNSKNHTKTYHNCIVQNQWQKKNLKNNLKGGSICYIQKNKNKVRTTVSFSLEQCKTRNRRVEHLQSTVTKKRSSFILYIGNTLSKI